jgi:Recombination directionality factor-like
MTAETAVAEPGGLGVQKRLYESGRIRLGEKGSRGEPKKLTKFRLTSASRPLLEAAARIYGGTVRAWRGAPDEGMWELYTESDTLDVMVPPTLQAYSQYWEEWSGGTCNLRCDGRWESISEKPCDHGDRHEDLGEGVKLTTRVSVILPKLPGLGVWRLETHGWNAAATLPATLELIGYTGRWIPAVIRLEQRSSKKRDEKTKKVLVRRFVVPVIDLAGVSFFEMLESGQASDAYEPALGAGPGSLALPPGPSRPPASKKVPRPELPAGPELDDETAPLSTPVERSFPEEPGDELFAAAAGAPKIDAATIAAAGARNDVDLAATIRAAAAASDLEGLASDEQRAGLASVFAGLASTPIVEGLRALWADSIGADGRPALTAAQAYGIQIVAGSLGDAFREKWAAIVPAAVPA